MPVLIIASEKYGNGPASDKARRRLRDAIHEHGYETTLATTPEDGLAIVVSDPGFGCVFLDWDLPGGSHFSEHAAEDIIKSIRARNKNLPIFLIAEKTLVGDLPTKFIKEVHEYVYLYQDTKPILQVGWTLQFDATMRPFFHHLVVPYPPGIPILMPGERFGKKKESPKIQFLLSLQEFSTKFPGFGHEIHRIEVGKEGVFWMRCVIEDGIIQEKKETCDKEEKSTPATTPISRPSAHPRSAMKSFKKGRS